jgi:cytochrome c biogenesis protein CcmG/thiol:disulfide interchange protein DsbE
MNKSVVFVLFAVVAVTAALFLSSKISKHPEASVNAGPQLYPTGPARGTMAPDFTLNVFNAQGKTIQLSSLQGKAVIVNFWATYCDPCKAEMPWLAELQQKYGSEGLQILGIVVDDPGDKTILDFTRKMGVNYPVLVGTDKVEDLYGGIDGLPTTFFLDRSGKVVDRVLGLESKSLIEDSIKKALGQGATTSASAQ